MADELTLFKTDLKTRLKEPGTTYYSANEIADATNKALAILSRHVPYIVKDESVVTVADSYELDISGISGLLNGVWSLLKPLEYEVDQDPPEYRDFEIIDLDTIKMKLDSAPAASSASVYLWCEKLHELDSDSTTLTTMQRSILLDIASAEATLQWCENCILYMGTGDDYINTLNVGASPEGFYQQYTRTNLQIMQALGAQKVALYRNRLKTLPKPRPRKQLWPTG